VELVNFTAHDDSGFAVLDGVSLTLAMDQAVAVTGPAGGGKEAFAALFARQIAPDTGSMSAGGEDYLALPEGVTGRRVGYAAGDVYVLAAPLKDNIL
jgi:putative ABC transport system ATP-binding protein